jgi:hypothetical protein
MGQDHKFFLISYEDYVEMGWDGYYPPSEDLSDVVFIHDDIIQYILNTLDWIPSINPAANYEKTSGICIYGITLFDKEGAQVILRLAKAWADLFSNGPTTLKLTGNYCFRTNEQGATEGNYDLLEVDRDELVGKLRKLQLFSEKVIKGDYLIFHHGL